MTIFFNILFYTYEKKKRGTQKLQGSDKEIEMLRVLVDNHKRMYVETAHYIS